jgi:type I restriction enzyme, S subunit
VTILSVSKSPPGHRWKRYPDYVETNSEWLGAIPSHWDLRRLRHVCEINPSNSEIADLPMDSEASFLPMECVGTDGRLLLDRTKTLAEVWQGFTYFRDGDVLVAKITPCFENG